MPPVKQIQPIGLLGRLEAIRAPTVGKARNGSRKMSTMLRPPVPQLEGGCTDRVRKYNTTVATNIASERAPSDQASQAAPRGLILAAPRPCSGLSLHHTTTTLQHDRLQSVTTNVTRRSSVEDVLRTS